MSDYKEWKAALWEQIKEHEPCQEEASAFRRARSEKTTWQVVLRNLEWLSSHDIDLGAIPPSVTHADGKLVLEGYKHPLPEGFTHCDGSLLFEGYDHPLPKSFTHCGGRLYLRYYKHPLPEGFKENKDVL